MTGRVSLPSTWIPRTPYRGPKPRDPGVLKLDGNEGSAPSADVLARLTREDPSVLQDYPDSSGLEKDIADWFGIAPERVVVTAGADDALDRVCRAFLRPGRRMILPIPTFEMIRRFAAATGGEVETVAWDDDFPTDAVIQALDDNVSVVTMISPNNPTGRVATRTDLTRVAEAASKAIVLLDHVYADYADEDLTKLAAGLENVVIVRTFSKAWGLAGCRVGFAIASEEVAAILRNAGNPFPVAGLSLAMVRSQLQRGRKSMEGHVERSRDGRERLMNRLAGHGAAPVPSQGNFVFSDFGERAAFVQDGLASLGILVRRFPHRPEVATGIRITVPERAEDLLRLEAGLNTVLSPEALLFDMDGVLADVEGSYRRCVFETAKSFGFPITREDMETAVMAGDANNDWVLTQRVLRGKGVEIPLAEITERFQEVYLGTAEAPGFRESEKLLVDSGLLERLAERLPLGIVTGRPRDEAEWFLKKTGIGEFFRALVCLEDGPLKPSPEPVRIALLRLGVQRAWMVGDTPDDIRAAAAAEVVPFGIVAPGDDPDRTASALLDAGASAVIPDLSTLQEFLT